MAGRSDVIGARADVSEVILGARVVARVFEGRPGVFWWVPALTDEAPVGPFRAREDAELDADVTVSRDLDVARWLEMLDT